MDVQTRSPMHRTIPFPTPTPHVPSVGFGFNLLSSHAPPAVTPPRAVPLTPSRKSAGTNNKRRHDGDDQEDENMANRSPSPMERPMKGLTKRVRVDAPKTTTSPAAGGKPASDAPDSIDVGLMLASLPPASHLTILTSLISKHPGLKSAILPLIPRPTLDAAVQAVNAAAKKIRDAHPYSQPAPAAIGLGFGFGFGSATVQSPPPGPSRNGGLSFGSANASTSASTSAAKASSSGTGMRDGYVQNRLRPVVAEFASTARSYLSYFTSTSSSSIASSSTSSSPHPSTSATSSHQHLHPHPVAELAHPSETFTYLHTLTLHIMRLSPLARDLVVREHEALLTRVQAEWRAWLDRIDTHVNRSGGMYGSESVRTWERGLDELVDLEDGLAAEGGGLRGLSPSPPPPSHRPSARGAPPRQQQQQQQQDRDRPMRALRDAWVTKVGWLIGRRVVLSPDQFGMDEDEEL